MFQYYGHPHPSILSVSLLLHLQITTEKPLDSYSSSDSGSGGGGQLLQSVPGTLMQAKEVLRLAHSMKAELEQMREEARRELEMARRERHDATLLKKNAAEILRIAKSKLAK